MLRRLFKWTAALCTLALVAWFFCRPVIVLHYAADAQHPVAYFYNESNQITRSQLKPGQVEKFHTAMFPAPDAWIEISVPFASRDGVSITPPYSRVDVYIDATTKIARVDRKTRFFDRF